MICRQFNEATIDEGEVNRLVPEKAPDNFRINIPDPFKGDVLEMLQFALKSDIEM
jgi:hypothetical protein